MQRITKEEFLRKCGLETSARKLREAGADSRYLCIHLDDGQRVYIELTASQFLDDFTSFHPGEQKVMVQNLLEMLAEPGDHLPIVDEKNSKQRAAMVARLKDKDGVQFLITR